MAGSLYITISFQLSKTGFERRTVVPWGNIRRRSYDRHPVGEEKPEEELMGEGFGIPAPPRYRYPRLFFQM